MFFALKIWRHLSARRCFNGSQEFEIRVHPKGFEYSPNEMD